MCVNGLPIGEASLERKRMAGQQPHDNVTVSPEYAAAYEHYRRHSSDLAEVARLAYEHAQRQLAQRPAGLPHKSNSAPLIIAAVIACSMLGMCGVFGIVGAMNSPGRTSSASTIRQTNTTPSPAATPTPSPTQEAPMPAASPPPKASEKPPYIPRFGDAALDGDFEFTINGMRCGVPRVGGEYFNKDAQGQFCLVEINVTNIGDGSKTFTSDYQKAFNSAGQEFEADGGAEIYINKDAATMYNTINPGNTVAATLVFDIPQGAKITKFELHDSMSSSGVTVRAK
jgi:hypothetical protein